MIAIESEGVGEGLGIKYCEGGANRREEDIVGWWRYDGGRRDRQE